MKRRDYQYLVWLLLLYSCKMEKGIIQYDHSPLFKTESRRVELKSKADSMLFKSNEELAILEEAYLKNRKAEAVDEEYLFSKNKIRVKRKTKIAQQDKFHIYYPKQQESIIYKRRKNGDLSVDTLKYDWRINQDWRVNYEILDFQKAAKEIKGYPCNFWRIKETKTTRLKTSIFEYEIYATPKIKFPMELVCGLYERIAMECPLEVKITDLNYPRYYSKIYVGAIAKQVEAKEFQVPEAFNIVLKH